MKSAFIAIFLTAASVAIAQGPHGQPPAEPPRSGSGLDMTKVQTVEGTVSAVNVAYGAQYPSIQMGQSTVKIAPVWYMLEKGFEIKTGDSLKVTAAPSLQSRDPYLSAISITNLKSNAAITLRDSNGVPLWMQPVQGMGSKQGQGPGSGPGMGPGTGPGMGPNGPQGNGGCALTSIATVSGTVEQVTAGAGIQMPAVVLSADGKTLTVKIGPERILEAADFEIKAGEKLTVKYGVTCTNETVALELTNAAGVKLVLRNEDGTPAW